jgi:hypothetical protein
MCVYLRIFGQGVGKQVILSAREGEPASAEELREAWWGMKRKLPTTIEGRLKKG